MADSEQDDRPLTAADLKPLTGLLDELRQRFDDLDDAGTPAQRREAQADVDESRDELAATAKKLGISPEKLSASIAAAKSAERKDELRPILKELLDELKAESDPPPDDEGADDEDDEKDPPASSSSSAAGANGRARPRTRTPAAPPPDTEPVTPHWSESHVGGLLR